MKVGTEHDRLLDRPPTPYRSCMIRDESSVVLPDMASTSSSIKVTFNRGQRMTAEFTSYSAFSQ
ncbi:hypothetical protein C0J52_19205 [Blattella germanica]|nr:hypothetical protein C0J52_19205 [Blattella germanica]